MKPLNELLEIVKSAKEKADNAHEHICKLAKDGAKSWRLSIPVQDDDSDVLLQAPLDLVPQLSDAVIDLITQLKDAQGEIRSLNTFNTQFTRADKRSWGDLFNEITQLKQDIEKPKKRISWLESGSIHTCHAECEKPLCVANREIDKLKLENAELKELRIMNLAGISTASFQNTRESTKERITKDNPYWTAAYDDVCRTVDREINLRESLDVAREALAKLERGSLLDHIATEALQNINTLAEGK